MFFLACLSLGLCDWENLECQQLSKLVRLFKFKTVLNQCSVKGVSIWAIDQVQIHLKSHNVFGVKWYLYIKIGQICFWCFNF